MGLFRRRQRVPLTKEAEAGGAMVCLYPAPDVASTLAQADGEPAEELHLTLAFLGPADELDRPEGLRAAVERFAATAPPLTGEVGGIGHFTAGPEPVTYASPDVPGLPEFRQALCEALCEADHEPSTEHGFTPHITLAYDHRDPEVPNLALAFNAVSVVIAGDRTDYPLTGKTAAEEASHMADLIDEVHSIDKADYSTEQRIQFAREGKAIPIKENGEIVGGRYPIDNKDDLGKAIHAFGRGNDKGEVKAHIIAQAKRLGATDTLPEGCAAKAEKVEVLSELWKDDAKQLVYGVVMQPHLADSEGDTVSPAEIEKAAHRYLMESRKSDIQHNEEVADVVPVESFIAPADMTYAGKPVLKGSWLMAVKVNDAEVWKAVTKEELTGFSIGGTAVRQD